MLQSGETSIEQKHNVVKHHRSSHIHEYIGKCDRDFTKNRQQDTCRCSAWLNVIDPSISLRLAPMHRPTKRQEAKPHVNETDESIDMCSQLCLGNGNANYHGRTSVRERKHGYIDPWTLYITL